VRPALIVAASAVPLLVLEWLPGLRFQIGSTLNGQIHTVLEVLSIIGSAMIFSVAWNALAWQRSSVMALACCCFGSVALSDLAHVALFEPTPSFAGGEGLARAYIPFFLARLATALALVVLACEPRIGTVPPRLRWVALAVSLVLGCLFAAAGALSTASALLFRPGVGPTPLKIAMDLSVAVVELAGALLFARQFGRSRDHQSGLMAAALGVLAMSQYAFTRYASASDAFFVYGHILKVIAYMALYRAMYVWMLRQPYLELLAARRTLAVAVERWRKLFEHSLDAVMIGTSAGAVLAANPAACRLFGRSEAELVAGGRAMVVFEGDPRLQPLMQARARDGSTRGELTYRRSDGSLFEAEVATATFQDAEGRELTNVVIRDLTDQKALEAQRAEMNVALERRVLERTRQLERANADLAQFSYGIAHDLRAPLAAIGGFAGALGQDGQPLAPRSAHYLARIVANVARMEGVIEAMLGLYRLSQSPLLVREVDLSEMARQIVDDLAFTAPQRKVEAVIEEGLRVRGDQALLHALLQNLIGNAWKFTSDREDGARIVLARLPGRQAAFEVRDNGVGFDPERAGELFAMFRRLHDASQFAGYGLGLAGAKKIVERHGGEIAIEGRPGEGATVRFSLGEQLAPSDDEDLASAAVL